MNTSRRQFLKQATACSIAGSTMATLGTALPAFKAHAAETSGYRALVCLFLFGGMDSHDVVLPFDAESYSSYAAIRAPLLELYRNLPGGSTRERKRLLPLSPANAAQFGEREFALTEEFSGLHSLFESGNAAIVGNVGPLIQPVTRSEFQAQSVPLPSRLFSHNDQQSTWLGLEPEGAATGWGGRFADAAINASANTFEAFSAISTSGNNLFQSGLQARPYPITARGGSEFDILASTDNLRNSQEGEDLFQALRSHLGSLNFTSSNLFARDIATNNARALTDNEAYNLAFANVAPLNTSFPEDALGGQLQSVAQSISLRNTLGMSRQIFFVSLGGFDSHSNQVNSLPGQQRSIDQAVTAFFQSMQEMGLENEVTLFTASDFGRTLAVNGDGTDHGWGGHHFVVGGGVNGGNIFGDIPPAVLEHSQDAGGGRLIPTLSLQQFAAPMGAWFGLNESEIQAALPGIENFPSMDIPLFNS